MHHLLFNDTDEERRLYLPTWAIISFVAWTSTYYGLCRYNSSRCKEWNCRTVTVLHGVLSFAVASWSAFIAGPFPIRFDVVGSRSNPLHEVAMIICFGYFVFDLIWILNYQPNDLLMIVHHLVCVVGLIVCMYQGVCGAEVIATIVGGEITNPFLQARWFLKQTSSYDSTAGRVVDFFFVFLFVFVRIGVGATLLYVALASPNVGLFFKAGGFTMYAISVLFLGQILQFAYRKLFGLKQLRRRSSPKKPLKNGTANGIVNSPKVKAQANGHIKQKTS